MPRTPDRQPLSLEQVTQSASELLLRDGFHQATVIAEGTQQTIITQPPVIPATHEGRVNAMLTLGLAVARVGEIGVLFQVFFVAEAWMSVSQEGKLPHNPPSKDPQRKEVLVIANLRVWTQEQALVLLDMLRDTSGHLSELKEYLPSNAGLTDVYSPLLAAFAYGFSRGADAPSTAPTHD
jgi:hypothetical protein